MSFLIRLSSKVLKWLVRFKFSKVSLFYNIVFENAQKSLFDLSIVNDIPSSYLGAIEDYAPNDFYGHATIYKKYCGFPVVFPIRATIQHAAFFGNYMWNQDLIHFKKSICWGENYKNVLISHGKESCHVVGAPFIYEDSFFDIHELDKLKSEFKKTLLVFPSHSTHYVDCDYDLIEFTNWIVSTRDSNGFDTVLVCMYWKDILKGTHLEYIKSGFKVVTAGHIFDINFTARLKSIFILSDAFVSNKIGSYVGYGLSLGKPFKLFDGDVKLSGDSEGNREMGIFLEDESYILLKSLCRDSDLFHVNEKVVAIVEKYWGRLKPLSKGDLRKIIENCFQD